MIVFIDEGGEAESVPAKEVTSPLLKALLPPAEVRLNIFIIQLLLLLVFYIFLFV